MIPRVLWLPSLPSEGGLSMDRYWKELEAQQRVHPAPGLSIRAALPQMKGETRRTSRFDRFWQKYIRYPVRVRWQSAGADLVHVLDHAMTRLLRNVPARVRKIVTVHDLAPLVAADSSLSVAQRERFRQTVLRLREADLILSDSTHTARDVVEHLGCDERRIRVLPLGANLAQFGTPQAAPLPDWKARFDGRKVVMSVGSAGERKNLKMLPGLLGQLQAGGWPVSLVRVGDDLPAAVADELRAVLGEKGMVELGKVSAEHLAGAYQRATLLVFPSFLEGFGLPVLEAMAAGCPVVCSNVSSLPEVGGEAALYFDPRDTGAAVSQTARLLQDEALRRDRIQAGREWSARFSWEAHSAALTDIYHETLAAAPCSPIKNR